MSYPVIENARENIYSCLHVLLDNLRLVCAYDYVLCFSIFFFTLNTLFMPYIDLKLVYYIYMRIFKKKIEKFWQILYNKTTKNEIFEFFYEV